MPWAAPRHCAHGHSPFTGRRCPVCVDAFRAQADALRPSAQGRGYDSKWRSLRFAFLGQHPLCAKCEADGLTVPSTVVDHIIPHRGDEHLFLDQANWQALCKLHHDRKTALEDGGFGRRRRMGRSA
jgi:5-methylcytosine-specific restriction protein A